MTNASNKTGKKEDQVFISYAEPDRDIADMIYSALESKGIPGWAAHRDISPGLNWPDEISKAISQSRIMILVLSSNTQKSRYVSREVTLAAHENIIIIPFCIEGVPLRGGLKLLLGDCQWINAFPGPQEKYLDQLIDTVFRHLGKAPAMLPKDEKKQPEVVKEVIRKQEKKRKKPLLQKRILIAVSIIILLTAAVFFINQLVKKEGTTTEDTPKITVKPGNTPDDTSQKQKSTGKTQQKPVEKTPGKKKDRTPQKKTSTGETKKIPQEEYIVKSLPGGDKVSEPKEIIKELKKEPVFIKEVKSKGAQVKQIGKDSWEAYYKKYDITMVYIPPGKFIMGSENGDADEKPAHEVYLDGYWLGKNEVTNAHYVRFLNVSGIDHKDGCQGKPCIETYKESILSYIRGSKGNYHVEKGNENHPASEVSWYGALEYCNWLSKETGLQFKLPTEAQWEKAARGEKDLKYPWGNHEPYYNGEWYANYRAHDDWDKSGEDGSQYTSQVGSYPQGASPYGLLDMAGNVLEWCSDWYNSGYYENLVREKKNKIIKNPIGPNSGYFRVVRGGSWDRDARGLRCTDRNLYRPSYRVNDVGFRLCQDIK